MQVYESQVEKGAPPGLMTNQQTGHRSESNSSDRRGPDCSYFKSPRLKQAKGAQAKKA